MGSPFWSEAGGKQDDACRRDLKHAPIQRPLTKYRRGKVKSKCLEAHIGPIGDTK